MMSHRLHLVLAKVFEVLGFLSGAVVAIVLWKTEVISGGVVPFVALGVAGLGIGLPRLIFRFVFPARCPVAECGGRAYAKSVPRDKGPGRRIVYVCRACDHEHDTGVGESQLGGTHARPGHHH